MTDLRTFCQRLQQLQRESGVPVDALARDPAIGHGRSQLYVIMRGQIASPPSWEFVDAFVAHCVRAARANRRTLSTSTDRAYWKHEHALLIDLAGRAEPARAERPATVLTAQRKIVRELPPSSDGMTRRLGLITGDIRQVHGIDAWVNSENTDMVMARIQDRSISAVIRYEGAERDGAGRVVVDHIADQLAVKVAGLQPPLAPGQVITTGAGELTRTNGVRVIIHAATVYGAPGAGFTPVRELGRCVENALVAAESPDWSPPLSSVLFPLLGCGEAGGDPEKIVPELIETAANRLVVAARRVETVWFLARISADLRVCERAVERVARPRR
jgi:O-acetyl-ADP-ribose deacetylase (regulator of RNase III)